MKELLLSALLPFLFYKRWMAVYLGPFAFPCGALPNCRIGCLLSAERTPLFMGCWAPLRRWCRFITARFWLSRCGQLLLQYLLLSPLLTDMSYYRVSYHLAISFLWLNHERIGLHILLFQSYLKDQQLSTENCCSRKYNGLIPEVCNSMRLFLRFL